MVVITEPTRGKENVADEFEGSPKALPSKNAFGFVINFIPPLNHIMLINLFTLIKT